MAEGFSLRDIVKPGMGSSMALRNHLKQEAERAAVKPGYLYGGKAEFLLKHGTFFTGREFPDKWEQHRGEMSECFLNSMRAAEAEPELRYFEGLYMVGGTPSHHAWCVDPEGEVVELTLPPSMTSADRLKHDSGGTIPGVPGEHWAYVGCEFDPAFVKEHYGTRGLPILDPGSYDYSGAYTGWPDDVFKHPYSASGWDMEAWEPPDEEEGDWEEGGPNVMDDPNQP